MCWITNEGTWSGNGGMRPESNLSECPYSCVSINFTFVLFVMVYSVLDINYSYG